MRTVSGARSTELPAMASKEPSSADDSFASPRAVVATLSTWRVRVSEAISETPATQRSPAASSPASRMMMALMRQMREKNFRVGMGLGVEVVSGVEGVV